MRNYDLSPSQQPKEYRLRAGKLAGVTRYRWDKRIPEEQLFPHCKECGRYLKTTPERALRQRQHKWTDVWLVHAMRTCAHCGKEDWRHELEVIIGADPPSTVRHNGGAAGG